MPLWLEPPEGPHKAWVPRNKGELRRLDAVTRALAMAVLQEYPHKWSMSSHLSLTELASFPAHLCLTVNKTSILLPLSLRAQKRMKARYRACSARRKNGVWHSLIVHHCPRILPAKSLMAQFDWISTITHSPDIVALLHSNNLPSPLQSVNLNASVAKLEDTSQEIQAVLDLLGNAVASLEAQMSRVRSLQHHYSAMLSPLRRVPAEIVMEILCHTWMAVDGPEETHVCEFNVFTVAEGPWYLGQVCRLWRDVVSTLCPKLWATMTIQAPRSDIDAWHPCGDVVAMLESVLERAGKHHPLDFLFSHCTVSSAEVLSVMQRCFDFMINHSARWRRTEFVVHPSFLPRLSGFRGKVNLLTDAYVKCWSYLENHSAPITAFEIAPRLRNLHLKGIHRQAQITFPASNLISFYDERPFAGDLLTPEYVDIIRSSPKLLSFSYHNYADAPVPPGLLPAHPRVISQSIQTFSVSSACFMRSVELPALREVVLTAGYDKDRNQQVIDLPRRAIIALSELLHHSHCSLIRLSVVDTTIVGNDLAADEGNDLGMEVLMVELAETVRVDGSVCHALVPCLSSFRIVLEGVDNVHVCFLELGQSWSYGLDPEDEDELRALAKTGLTLDFDLYDF
ncbi:uncharacterized protein EV420DRAFT_1480080 [Desarmillaria tabescens]|uniref:F-box domain-containing protein n=1 Tax=Armillaria tabescens TaxID=1929756 RepID=A0AA39KBZ3_ARMTA|nr:uncharacterized protein EV420DRAFT_1480080 [Desarmillaria tabescens]KAK0458354.1 hypothetical protein EV420DRAFT_1480080 [Desarmillaria tabescens]